MKKIFIVFTILSLAILTIFTNEVQAKTKKQPTENEIKINYMNLDWWNRFNDPILTSYIQELYEKNHDLKIAALNVKESEKVVKLSFANELPRLSIDGSMGRILRSSEEQKGVNHIYESYSQYEFLLPLTASYEVDIWGKNRFRTKSMEQKLDIIKQDERATYIGLTSAFASDYFNLIKINKLIELEEEIINLQKTIVQKEEIKFNGGMCNEVELLNEKKYLTQLFEDINALKKVKATLENQFKTYLSDFDKDIKLSSYDTVKILDDIPDFLSASVIENRPDYVISQDQVKKVGYDVKVARRELLPKFVIYGQIGFNAYNWGDIFKHASQLANVGVVPTIDLFSGGRKMSFLKLRKYQYDEAVENYKKTVLTSIQEVNDGLAGIDIALDDYKGALDRLNIENRKYQLMQKKNEIGALSDLDLLFDRQKQLVVEKNEVSTKINCLITAIGLYKAVGGKDLYTLSQDDGKKENI